MFFLHHLDYSFCAACAEGQGVKILSPEIYKGVHLPYNGSENDIIIFC